MFDKLRETFDVAAKSFKYFFSSAVKFRYKIIPFLAILYGLYPADLSFDFIPVIGQIDDVSILMGALLLFVYAVEHKILEKASHR